MDCATIRIFVAVEQSKILLNFDVRFLVQAPALKNRWEGPRRNLDNESSFFLLR